MTLLFKDSYDHYVTADLPLKGYSGNNLTTVGAFGRFGTSGLRQTNTNVSQLTWVFPAPLATVIWGSAYRFGATLANNAIMRFMDSAASVQVAVYVNGDGRIVVTGGGGAVLATGTTILAPGVYYHIQVKATFHNSAGAVTVKLNGADEVVVSGVDTQTSANASADRVHYGIAGGGAAANTDYDDTWLCDTVDQSIAQPGSPANNDFLGDCRVEYLPPNGDGNSSQWVGSDGNSVNNSLLVDEAAQNGDTDYVESSTVGEKDTYAMGPLTSTTGSVLAVGVVFVARKTDAGVRSIRAVVRDGGTEQDSPADITLNATYAQHHDIRGAAPGAAGWTIAKVNGMEIGPKVAA